MVRIIHDTINDIPDWTQEDINGLIGNNLLPAGTTTADVNLASNWNHDHVVETTGSSVGDVITNVAGVAEWAAPDVPDLTPYALLAGATFTGSVLAPDFNGVALTDAGIGDNYLADDGTYKPIDLSSYAQLAVANTWTAAQTFEAGLNTPAVIGNQISNYGTATTRNDSYSFGHVFIPKYNIIITELGRQYPPASTLDHVVAIWDSNNTSTPIASGTVLASSTSDSDGVKWVSITPITLIAGHEYAIASAEGSGDASYNTHAITLANTNDFIDYSGIAYGTWGQIIYGWYTKDAYGTSGSYPNNIGALNQTYSAPTFKYHKPIYNVDTNGNESSNTSTSGSFISSTPTQNFVSNIPYTTPVNVPRVTFYAKSGNTGFSANNTILYRWTTDVNGVQSTIMDLEAIDATTLGLVGGFYMAPYAIKSPYGGLGAVTVQYAYLQFAQAGNLVRDMQSVDGNKPFWMESDATDGASAIGYRFRCNNTFSTAGALLATFESGTTVKASIDKDGGYSGSTVTTTTYTVATLPTGVAGMRAFVTDALAPAFGVAVAGSGAVGIPVYHDGINWKVG